MTEADPPSEGGPAGAKKATLEELARRLQESGAATTELLEQLDNNLRLLTLASAQSKKVTAGFRTWAVVLFLTWLPQVLSVVLGWPWKGTPNNIHLDFYMACAPIYPVLVIAGLVELGAMQRQGVPGTAWWALGFVIPSIGGEIATLDALAHHLSTTTTYQLAWLSLGFTVVSVLSIVLLRPSEAST